MTPYIDQTTAHIERIRNELKKSGVSSLALLRFTARYLPKVIHENEHIEAAIFGRHKKSEGVFGYIEGMLVATDMRIIYLDHRPGYTTLDEVAYDVVSGVNIASGGISSNLTLFTRIANYTVSFAKSNTVKKFADYIESKRIDSKPLAEIAAHTSAKNGIDSVGSQFLREHDTAVLSTIERGGTVTGAVVFYIFMDNYIYLLTKDDTRKARNMMLAPHVALTVYDADQLQTAQISGVAEVELDPVKKQTIYEQITNYHAKMGQTPPVTKIRHGSFIVFRIAVEQFSFSDFSH